MAATPPPQPEGHAPSSEKLSKMTLESSSQQHQDFLLTPDTSHSSNAAVAAQNRQIGISAPISTNGHLSNGSSHPENPSSFHLPPAEPAVPAGTSGSPEALSRPDSSAVESIPLSAPVSANIVSSTSLAQSDEPPPSLNPPLATVSALSSSASPQIPLANSAPSPSLPVQHSQSELATSQVPAITSLDSVVEAPLSNVRGDTGAGAVPSVADASAATIAAEAPRDASVDLAHGDAMDVTDDGAASDPTNLGAAAPLETPVVEAQSMEVDSEPQKSSTTEKHEAQVEIKTDADSAIISDNQKDLQVPNATSDDTEMHDAPPSPSKLIRARDKDDEQEAEERAVKRSRTDDVPSQADFKIPEAPSQPDAVAPKVEDEASGPSTITLDTSFTAGHAQNNETPIETPSESQAQGQHHSTITSLQNKAILQYVRDVKRLKDAAMFKEPVDPVALNIPTYFDVVKEPMDVGTIEQKVKDQKYETIQQVIDDFNLMVNNSRAFNGPDHLITQAGGNLLTSFEKKILILPSSDEVEPSHAEKKAKKAASVATTKETAPRRPSRAAATASSPTGDPNSPRFALKSGLPQIRRDSTVADGRAKRTIKPPQPKDLPYSNVKPKSKKVQLELRFCQEVHDELMLKKHWPSMHIFYDPVDPVALQIPTYFQIIKKPMDLTTVKGKLDRGEYENPQTFYNDVKQMFTNCFTFNPPDDNAFRLGKSAEAIFEEKWASKAKWLKEKAPPSKSQTPVSSEAESEEEEEEESSEDEVGQLAIDVLKKQRAHLTTQIESMEAKQRERKALKAKPKAKSSKKGTSKVSNRSKTLVNEETTAAKKKSKAPKKEPKPKQVSYEEKQEISMGIPSIPPDQMHNVLSIIRENHPNLTGGEEEEMELDIDELSHATLWKLLQFVRKYTQPPPKSNAGGSSQRRQADNAHAPRPKKKNKPMSKYEQEARISQIKGQLASFDNPGQAHSQSPVTPRRENGDDESSEDDDASSAESEEE